MNNSNYSDVVYRLGERALRCTQKKFARLLFVLPFIYLGGASWLWLRLKQLGEYHIAIELNGEFLPLNISVNYIWWVVVLTGFGILLVLACAVYRLWWERWLFYSQIVKLSDGVEGHVHSNKMGDRE